MLHYLIEDTETLQNNDLKIIAITNYATSYGDIKKLNEAFSSDQVVKIVQEIDKLFLEKSYNLSSDVGVRNKEIQELLESLGLWSKDEIILQNPKITSLNEFITHQGDIEELKVKDGNKDLFSENDINRIIKKLDCDYLDRTDDTNGCYPIFLNGLYKITLDLQDGALDPTSQRAQRIVEKARKRLHQNRNLCEDFVHFEIVEPVKVCVCLHLDILPEFDAEEVMAKAIFGLQEFLTPTIKFHTLQALLEKGLSGDQIYNGPVLEHGFLNDEEVTNSDLRKEIFTSDLYKVLLAIPEIKSVKELKLQVGEATGFSANWCYPLEGKKPVIDPCCSNMTVSKGVVTIKIKDKDIAPFLDYYNLVYRDIPNSDISKLPSPKGVYRPDLADFTSIQYDFPRTYYLGDEVPADSVGEERLAHIKQLKAYLSFYDRLLANYLQQLSRVRDMFAIKTQGGAETVFFSNLQMIPGIAELINEENPIIQTALEEPVIKEQLEKIGFAEDRDKERRKAIQEIIQSQLKKIASGEDNNEERREKILNHLIARFGEQFTDYTLQLFQQSAITSTYNKFEDYLEDKSSHLAELPALIRDRAKGYNHKLFRTDIQPIPDVWNTTNISGLKRKVYSLLGINPESVSLICDPKYRVDLVRDAGKERTAYFISLIEQETQRSTIKQVLLVSDKSYNQRNADRYRDLIRENIETDAAAELLDSSKPSFSIIPAENNTSQYRVRYAPAGSTDVILFSEPRVFKDTEELLKHILKLTDSNDCRREGFHLVEHILLRPNDNQDQLLTVPKTCEPAHPPVDPYSFWITVVLPGWTRRFQDGDFRKYFEQIFLAETPAHIAVCFLWIEDRVWMKQFEDAFEKWREALAKCTPNECKVTELANSLIEILKKQPCPCCCFDRDDFQSSCEPTQSITISEPVTNIR